MATKFKELTLELVDEGRLLKDLNGTIKEGMRKLIEFKRNHGKDKAKGSKAVITLTLSMQFDGQDEHDFSVKGAIAQKLPSRPSSVSKAMETEGDDGELTLFVRASGSTEDHPLQGVLTTKEGAVVDPKTGEVIETKAKGKAAAAGE
jgi:hypothetical protein